MVIYIILYVQPSAQEMAEATTKQDESFMRVSGYCTCMALLFNTIKNMFDLAAFISGAARTAREGLVETQACIGQSQARASKFILIYM